LKLDRQFIANAHRDPDGARILRASIAMGCEMGLRCVAEGVESAGVRDRLAEYGCAVGQGWLWSPAIGEDKLHCWLGTGRSRIRTLPSQRASPECPSENSKPYASLVG
jgi:EAL domain-containing protein (putative c-di-GMP-specific phosphodiesterase class I)